jgi:tetratricopeptide (TPR) repeat protein
MGRKRRADPPEDLLGSARSLLGVLAVTAGRVELLKRRRRVDVVALRAASEQGSSARLRDLRQRGLSLRARCGVFAGTDWGSFDEPMSALTEPVEALERTVDASDDVGQYDEFPLVPPVAGDDEIEDTDPSAPIGSLIPDPGEETEPELTDIGDLPDGLIDDESLDDELLGEEDELGEEELAALEDLDLDDLEDEPIEDVPTPMSEDVGLEGDDAEIMRQLEAEEAAAAEAALTEAASAEADGVLELVGDEPEPEPEPEPEAAPVEDVLEVEEEVALFEVDESHERPVQDTVKLTDETRTNLVDELGQALLPTIRDGSGNTGPIAAAAIQLKADGSAQALGRSEEEIFVELGDAGEEYDAFEAGDGFGLELEEEEYEDDDEDSSAPRAPQLTSDDDYSNYSDGSVELTGDDISAIEDVDPSTIAALEGRAQEALERGDLNSAAMAYSDLIELDPANLEAYLGRGRCYLDLGDYAAAMSDFQKAEDLDPEGPESLVAMGELFFARKEYSRAIEFFDQAIELDSSHAMARCRRGISFYYKKSYRQAFLDLQKAYTLDPEIPNIRKYVQMAIKKLERSGDG